MVRGAAQLVAISPADGTTGGTMIVWLWHLGDRDAALDVGRTMLDSLRIELQPALLDAAVEEERFELMEMTPPLSIQLDAQTRLPLRVSGQATRSRRLAVELVRAEL